LAAAKTSSRGNGNCGLASGTIGYSDIEIKRGAVASGERTFRAHLLDFADSK